MKRGDKSWAEYLDRERGHTEDPSSTRNFFMSCLAYTPDILSQHWQCVLEIGNGMSDGFRGLLCAASHYCLGPLYGDESSPWGSLRIRAEDMTIPANTFGLVAISNALDHCESPAVVGRKVSEVMSHGGVLFAGHYIDQPGPHPWAFESLDEVPEMFPTLDLVAEIETDLNGHKGYGIVVMKKSV